MNMNDECTAIWQWSDDGDNKDITRQAADILRAGDLVAYPTETVYGLGANGLDPQAVEKVYKVKKRPSTKPLLLAVSGRAMVNDVAAHVPDAAEILMKEFWPGPLSIVLRRKSSVPAVVAADGPTIGVRCPDHPVPQKLVQTLGSPITSPSANLSGKPSCTTAQQVLKDLQDQIAGIIDAGRCEGGIESTVVQVTSESFQVLRPGAVTRQQIEDCLGACQVEF